MYRKIQKLFDLQPTKVLICLRRAALMHVCIYHDYFFIRVTWFMKQNSRNM